MQFMSKAPDLFWHHTIHYSLFVLSKSERATMRNLKKCLFTSYDLPASLSLACMGSCSMEKSQRINALNWKSLSMSSSFRGSLRVSNQRKLGGFPSSSTQMLRLLFQNHGFKMTLIYHRKSTS